MRRVGIERAREVSIQEGWMRRVERERDWRGSDGIKASLIMLWNTEQRVQT